MNKNGLKIILSLLLLLTFFCCQKEETPNKNLAPFQGTEKIASIEFSTIGGKKGGYRIIKINKDSLYFQKGIAAENNHQESKKAISSTIWNNLLSSLRISDLDHITSAPSLQPFDGVDEIFQIKTQKTTHFYVNSQGDSLHYPQLQNLKNKIEHLLPKEN